MENDYNCPKCGQALLYEELTNNYRCLTCGDYYEQQELDSIKQKATEVFHNDYSDLFVEIQCKLCGKKVIVNKGYDYGVCPFCFNNLIDYNETIVDFYPEMIIPFKETQSQFLTHIVDTLKNGGCPPELIAGVNVEYVKGLYLPFFKYVVENDYRCFLETKEINNRFGNDGFYYQEIAFIDSLDVLCSASSVEVPNHVIDDIADFDYKKIIPYNPSYIGAGYFTVSDVYTHDKVWRGLGTIVRDYTEKSMSRYVGKTEEIKKITLINNVKNIVRKFILLPFWVLETNYNNETHQIYINGQTGRVASDIEFEQPAKKKSLFGKEVVEKYQVRKIDEQKVKYKRFNNGIDYHNEVRKYDSNSATKDQKIGAMRTR